MAAMLVFAAAAATLAGSAGCTPKDYRVQADAVAADIIKSQQKQAIGREEPFTVESPADTLRRRLMLDQDLPYSTQASLGVGDLVAPKSWPEKSYPPRPGPSSPPTPTSQPLSAGSGQGATLRLSLLEALRVAAANNREYQTNKEAVYTAALRLDLEALTFRNTFSGSLVSAWREDLSNDGVPVGNWSNSAEGTWRKRFESGAAITGHLALDLVKLLTQDRTQSRGISADATVTVPLLRGAGPEIVTEPLTQAQRNVVYAIARLERYKQTLAVQVASEYLNVLQQQDQVANAEENYRNLILSTRRARRLADAGRMSEIQVDQARQSELSARNRWITARQSYQRRLDSFKSTLGLPTDCLLELDRGELDALSEQAKTVLGGAAAAARIAAEPSPQVPSAASGPAVASAPASVPAEEANAPVVLIPPTREGGGPLEMDPAQAVPLALKHRLDLRIANGQVYDAQRGVIVAADALRAGLTLTAGAQMGGRRGAGSAGAPDVGLRPDRGTYNASGLLDLPLERTAERNAYRQSLIDLAAAVRDVQQIEDSIKLQVRSDLRDLLENREGYKIQVVAVALAQRRVKSTQLFLEAGRAQMRDLLDAQQDLLNAQNALSAAVVNYRISELTLQRDLGLLLVDEKGIWREYRPPSNP